jgi:hypothetical protein
VITPSKRIAFGGCCILGSVESVAFGVGYEVLLDQKNRGTNLVPLRCLLTVGMYTNDMAKRMENVRDYCSIRIQCGNVFAL